jgi:conserved hypothetical integral membrane protein TIGR02206
MKPEVTFHAFGFAHLVVIFLTIAIPLGLAAVVRASSSRWFERIVAISLAACLTVNYLGAAVFLWRQHHLYWAEMLPFQLCDWAMVAIIVALINGRRSWFEIAYFWGIGGTLQAIVTPNLPFGFPDFRFFSFFIGHSGIVAGVIFLMATRGYRPHVFSIVRTFAWSELYFVVTLLVDLASGMNYGFLLHKPEMFSLLSYLSDWRPLYLLQMHGLALLFFSALYIPFALADLLQAQRIRRATCEAKAN